MSVRTYNGGRILSQPPQYTDSAGEGALYMARKKEIDYTKTKIIHKTPKMTDIERENKKKAVGNDLYEIFLRIQGKLNSESG